MKLLVSILLFLTLATNQLIAEAENPAHNELRALKAELEGAIAKRDMNSLLERLHPNIVVTWYNAEVSRRREGVKEYINRMLFAKNPIVTNFSSKLDVDELTIFYDNTGIAFGKSIDNIELAEGITIDSTNRWTATLYKQDGKWLVTSVHFSTNLFDNPLLNTYKDKMYLFIAVSLVVGLALGYVIRSFKKS
ncbi:MAG: polyketide cyclase [Spirochaetota bacterium]